MERGALPASHAPVLESSLRTRGGNLVTSLLSIGFREADVMAAASVAAGIPVAPDYLFEHCRLETVGQGRCERFRVVPVKDRLGRACMVFANPDTALRAGALGFGTPVMFLALPSVIDEILGPPPIATDVDDIVERAGLPPGELDPAPTERNLAGGAFASLPREATSTDASGFDERPTRALKPGNVSGELEDVVRGASHLQELEEDAVWLPLPGGPGADPFGGDTLIETLSDGRAPSAVRKLDAATRSELSILEERGEDVLLARPSDVFQVLADDEVDSFDS